MRRHHGRSALAGLALLGACDARAAREPGETPERVVSAPLSARAVRHERSALTWDTTWTYVFPNPEALLLVRASPVGVHVLDLMQGRVTLLGHAGTVRWTYPETVDTTRQAASIRDLEVDAAGRTFLLDRQHDRIEVLDSLGRAAGTISTRAIRNIEQMAVLRDGRFLLQSVDSSRLVVLNGEGHVEGHVVLSWPDRGTAHPLARQLIVTSGPATGRWMAAALLGSGWVVARGVDTVSAVHPNLERRRFPAVTSTSTGSSTFTGFTRYTGCTACDVAVADSSIYMLTGGTSASAKTVIDRYDAGQGAYRESYRFATRLQSFTLDARHFYIVTEDPETRVIALRPQSMAVTRRVASRGVAP